MLFHVNTHPASFHVWKCQNGFSTSFYRLVTSCPKSSSSTHSIDQMKNQPKFGVLLQPPRFNIQRLMNLSIYNDIPKYNQDLSSY